MGRSRYFPLSDAGKSKKKVGKHSSIPYWVSLPILMESVMYRKVGLRFAENQTCHKLNCMVGCLRNPGNLISIVLQGDNSGWDCIGPSPVMSPSGVAGNEKKRISNG